MRRWCSNQSTAEAKSFRLWFGGLLLKPRPLSMCGSESEAANDVEG
jgi:hypothetical protein